LGGRSGEFIRVTHPHLSNAIYEAVRELADSKVRARDLNRAFVRCMQSGEYTTARLILYRIAENHERLATLDGDELARGVTSAWLASFAEIPVASPELAGFWTNWVVWSARQPLVSRLLGEQPLDRAREALRRGHANWAVLWASLWGSATGHSGLVSDAETWLRSAEGSESRQWSLVWERNYHALDVGGVWTTERQRRRWGTLRDLARLFLGLTRLYLKEGWMRLETFYTFT
jgi:hypothetical protein